MLHEVVSSALQLPPLVYLAVVLSTILYMRARRRVRWHIPPLPCRPYPIVGHLPMLKDGFSKAIGKWRKSTGDIFSLYTGPKLMVVINSYALVKEAFIKHADVFSDRPESVIIKNTPFGDLGIIHSSGANWKEQRGVSFSILRSFGMGKNSLGEKINEEMSFFLQALSDLRGKPTDIHMLANASISNVICSILFGHRFEYDDPYFTKLIKLMDENMSLLRYYPLLTAFPWLKYIPGPDRYGAKKLLQNLQDTSNHFKYQLIKTTEDECGTDNFINAYYQEKRKREKAGNSTTLGDNNLLRVIGNLFVAGTETTGTALRWAMLLAIHYPDTQEKIYKEISDVIGAERTPVIEDKSHMNYTMAFIYEILRFACVAPYSLPHLCSENVEIAGYTIPKGTTVIANLYEILHDDETWGDPYAFRPERFLDKDQGVTVPEEFLPFSLGRRYCMGDSVAKMNLFLLVTGIFQRFEVRAEDPKNLPSLEPRLSAANSPQLYRLRLIERK